MRTDARPSPLASGLVIGRYIVLERVGEGGMGVVYGAYDPMLDRKVALKLMRPHVHGGDASLRTTLAHEAQAMARLAHPHVVAVHDVGTFGDGTFLAMEFIDGPTMHGWLAERQRSTREIIEAFVQAGRGLSAAHEVGLVHRDFKPANVLIGKDGRARVTDFGLARIASYETAARTADGHTTPAGTPAYMAPEQRNGRSPDTRSDQYSFCVAFFEALTGKLPSEGPANLPAFVRSIVMRGLSAPETRYASMNELLADIARASRPRWLAPSIAAAVVVALVASGLAYQQGRKQRAVALMCHGGSPKIAAVWNDARRNEMSRAFVGTGKPFAADAFASTAHALDAYTKAWTTSYTDTCEATQVRGEQSTALLDLRMACLDERRSELAGFVDEFVHADAAVVKNAVGAQESLVPLSRCSDATELLRPGAAPDAAIAPKVQLLRDRLAKAHAMSAVGRYRAALPIAEETARDASALGFRPLEGVTLYGLGSLQSSTGDMTRAEETLRRALFAADAGGDDRTRALVAIKLIQVTSVVKQDHAELPKLRDTAAAAIARLGDDKELRSALLVTIGSVFVTMQKAKEAIAALEEALPVVEVSDGPESRSAASVHYELGRAYVNNGQSDRAAEHYQRALVIAEKALGPKHDLVGTIASGVGALAFDEGRYGEAETAMRRCVELESASLGANHVIVAYPLAILAEILVAQRRYGEAFEPARQALAIYDEHALLQHSGRFYAHRALAGAYAGSGDPAHAIEAYEHALAYKAYSAVERAQVEFALARSLIVARRNATRARELAESAAATYDKEAASPGEIEQRAQIYEWLKARGAVRTAGR